MSKILIKKFFLSYLKMIIDDIQVYQKNLDDFVRNIIDFDYKPSVAEYTNTTTACFNLATKYAGFNKQTDVDNPFIALNRYIEALLFKHENGKYNKLDEISKLNLISNAMKRIGLLQNICRFSESMIKNIYMQKKVDDIQSIYSRFLMKTVVNENLDLLINNSVNQLVQIFQSAENPDLSLIISLFQVIYFGSDSATNTNGEKLIAEIERAFEKISPNITKIPAAMKQVRNFIDCISKDAEITERFISVFQEKVIKPLIPKIAELTQNVDLFNAFHPNVTFEGELIISISYVRSKQTDEIIESSFTRTIDNFITTLQKESKVKKLCTILMNLLRFIDKFNNLMYADQFTGFTVNTLKKKLYETKFHKEFGEKWPICLSYILNAYLSRGNTLQGAITQQNIIRLISFVVDKDVFLKQYEIHLFNRLATNATFGKTKEIDTYNAILLATQNESLEIVENLIKDYEVRVEKEVPNFSYIMFRFSDIPQKHSSFYIKLPADYVDLRDKATGVMHTKWPGRKYEWLDTLATCEAKLRTKEGATNMTLSLSQAVIVKNIVDNEGLNFDSLVQNTIIDRKRVLKNLNKLINRKIIKISDRQDLSKAKISINQKYWEKTALIADNWKVEPAKIEELPKIRMQSLQAQAIRIMKINKIIRYSILEQKIYEEASKLFKPRTEDIAQCLRELAAMKYIEIGDNDRVIYLK